MNYEIITSRWRCPHCGDQLRLCFIPKDPGQESTDEFICREALCAAGHELPGELAEEAVQLADEEFYAAMERGEKTGETWHTPVDAEPGYETSEPTI